MTTPIPTSPVVTGETYAIDTPMTGTPWEGVLMVEGVETGDGREFALNSITWPDPTTTVIALQRNIEDSHGGQPTTKTVLVGRITKIWRDEKNPAIVHGAGVFDDEGVEGAEALRQVRDGFLRGISVDPDSIKDADVELVFGDDTDFHGKHNQKTHGDRYLPSGKKATKKKPRQSVKWGAELADDPDEPDDTEEPPADDDDIGSLMDLFKPPTKTIFHAGRLRAATLVNIPAFVEAKIWLVDPETVQPSVDTMIVASGWSTKPWNGSIYETRMRVDDAAIRAAYAHVDPNARSILDAKFLHHEIDGDGAVGPANLAACAAAIRFLTSDRAASMHIADRRHAYDHLVEHVRLAGHTVEEVLQLPVESPSIVAALESLEGPPAEWFSEPEPDGFMAPVVTDAVTAAGWRQFKGHGAAWGTCHIGFMGECRTPPREGEHAYFRTGEVVCADGSRVAVGSVTLGMGHAPTIGISPMRAVEHYDNTAAVVALVASSEGRHGIWLAGAIPPWVAPERVTQLQASGQVSGDWRSFGGKLRLVAFLAVNHGGFPVPRLAVGMHSGRQVSLVAAGMRPDPTYVTSGERSVMRRIAASIGRDPASRAAEIRRRVKGE